jgi:hypothetical protein
VRPVGAEGLSHFDYVEKYDKTADKFIIGRLKAVGIE